MSPPGYKGYSQSGIKGSLNGVNGKTIVTTSKTVPAGWIGVQAMIYKKSDGSLVGSSSWVYNSDYTDSLCAIFVFIYIFWY